MDNDKFIELCKEAFSYFLDNASSHLDKKKQVFNERKHLLNNIQIKENEKIKCVAPIHTGNWGITRNGLLVATDTRVFVIFNKGLGGADVHTFYYKRISSIDYKKTALTSDLTISTNGDKEMTVACFSSNTLGELLREYIEDSFDDSQNTITNEINNNIEQIEKLFKLKESGALSEEEFITLKQKYI